MAKTVEAIDQIAEAVKAQYREVISGEVDQLQTAAQILGKILEAEKVDAEIDLTTT